MTSADLVAQLLRHHAALQGAMIAVNGHTSGTEAVAFRVVAVSADAVLIERDALPSEGGPRVRRAPLRTGDRIRAERLLASALTAIARLQRRSTDLADAEPPWSFSISSAAAAALNHLGVHPLSLAAPGPAAEWGRHPANGPGAEGVDVRLVGSRLSARSVAIPATRRAPAMLLDETTGLPSLTVLTPLPDSLVFGCAGRRLGEIIDHPAVPFDAKILSMTQQPLDAPEVRLIVEDVRVPVSPPPGPPPKWLGLGERSDERPLFT